VRFSDRGKHQLFLEPEWHNSNQIYVNGFSKVVIRNNYISNNYAASYGGGIAVRYCSPLISGNVIVNNTASSLGGGIYIYGATASMLTEYLRTLKIKPSVALATALIYGIKTDTNNFEKECTLQDVLCFQYLFKHMNRHLLHKIEASDLRRSELKYFRRAFEEVKIRKQRLLAHIGRVPNPDILVVIADFFNHVHDIGWVFISGEYKDRLVVIIRCDGYRKDAGKLAQKVFGSIGFAGGHREKARAEVPLEKLFHNGANFSTRSLIRMLERHFKR
jgi:nanoRNase/pAp phosphatase (c-di-AMP/oligoRNAs hydrolase)